MGLLNYSTSVEAKTSIAEITEILARIGARSISHGLDATGNVTEISFKVQHPKGGEMSFRLPADPRPVMQIINEQTEKRVTKKSSYGYSYQSRIVPKRFHNDMDQARRVSWRILKDWIEAQMAILEVGMVQLHQVFLPYAIMKGGQTVFEMVEQKNLLGYSDK